MQFTAQNQMFQHMKIICQGHISNPDSDLSTLLTHKPLGKEIYNKQPPKILKALHSSYNAWQVFSIHHVASPRAVHQTLISYS